MSEENANLKPDLENSEREKNGTSGEATLDPAGTGAAAANVSGRMSIGPYVLVRTLGEGGMGQVWLAEQAAPVKRKVALKLIKGGLYDRAVIQRADHVDASRRVGGNAGIHEPGAGRSTSGRRGHAHGRVFAGSFLRTFTDARLARPQNKTNQFRSELGTQSQPANRRKIDIPVFVVTPGVS